MLNFKKQRFSRFCLIIVVLLLYTCDKKINENNETQTKEVSQNTITKQDIENLNYIDFAFDEAAQNIIKDWERFSEIETHIEALKNGDLSFFEPQKSDTDLRTLFSDFKNTIPLELNTTPILVRITVLENYFFKLKDTLNYAYTKEDLLNTIKELLIARSNLILLINKKIEDESQNIVKPTF